MTATEMPRIPATKIGVEVRVSSQEVDISPIARWYWGMTGMGYSGGGCRSSKQQAGMIHVVPLSFALACRSPISAHPFSTFVLWYQWFTIATYTPSKSSSLYINTAHTHTTSNTHYYPETSTLNRCRSLTH
jgi:hypothetical protein